MILKQRLNLVEIMSLRYFKHNFDVAYWDSPYIIFSIPYQCNLERLYTLACTWCCNNVLI